MDEVCLSASACERVIGNGGGADMVRITDERLIRHLARAGFVLMWSESSPAPTTVIMPSSRC